MRPFGAPVGGVAGGAALAVCREGAWGGAHGASGPKGVPERGLWARAAKVQRFRKPPRSSWQRGLGAAYRPDLVSGLLSRESTLCVLQERVLWA